MANFFVTTSIVLLLALLIFFLSKVLGRETADALGWTGLILVVFASLFWILFDMQRCNDWAGKMLFYDLRKGIEKLTDLSETYQYRTLSDHEERESYQAVLEVIKQNAKNLDYQKALEIESKSLVQYKTTPETKPLIELISPPVTLLGKTMGEAQPVTNPDILKLWARDYEKNTFSTFVFLMLLVGFIAQVLERVYGTK